MNDMAYGWEMLEALLDGCRMNMIEGGMDDQDLYTLMTEAEAGIRRQAGE